MVPAKQGITLPPQLALTLIPSQCQASFVSSAGSCSSGSGSGSSGNGNSGSCSSGSGSSGSASSGSGSGSSGSASGSGGSGSGSGGSGSGSSGSSSVLEECLWAPLALLLSPWLSHWLWAPRERRQRGGCK